MHMDPKIPILMGLLYGEASPQRWEAADETVRWWAEGFERWLSQWKTPVKEYSYYRVLLRTWGDVCQSLQKGPWELGEAELRAWMEQMEQRGFLGRTINGKVGQISSFYKFIIRNWRPGPGSPETAPANPTQFVARIKVSPRRESMFLSQEEVQALLAAVDREESLIGKRDYAFLLAVLFGGLSGEEVRLLKWGEIDRKAGQEGEATLVFAQTGAQLGREVQEAILEYLRASGRREEMAEDEYVFASRRLSAYISSAGDRRDWLPDHPLQPIRWLTILRQYAARAGLNPILITWATLRNTATLIRLETGAEMKDIQRFLGQNQWRYTAEYLTKIALKEKEPLWAGPDQETIDQGKKWNRPKEFKRLETARIETLLPTLGEAEVHRLEQEDPLDTLNQGMVELRRLGDEIVTLDMPQAGEIDLRKIAHQTSKTTYRISQILPLQDRVNARRQKDAEVWSRWKGVVERMQARQNGEDEEDEPDDEEMG